MQIQPVRILRERFLAEFPQQLSATGDVPRGEPARQLIVGDFEQLAHAFVLMSLIRPGAGVGIRQQRRRYQGRNRGQRIEPMRRTG